MKKFFKNVLRFIKMTFSFVRAVTLIGMIFVGAVSVYLIYMAYHVTVSQYNESLTWEKTAYDAPLAEVEPVLVSNTVDANKVAAADSWNALDDYLETLDEQDLNEEKAEKIMEEAAHWQEVYGMDSDSITRLSLYLEIEKAIPATYSTLNTDDLASLTLELHNLELEKTTKSGQRYMKRIRQVVTDFMTAKSTVTDTILSVGTLKDGVWTIPYTYERSDLADILKQIQAMRKFPALGDTADVLADIADALNFNKNARDYFAYKKFKEQMQSLTRSDYISVSSIYTYGQALDNGINVSVKQKKGYTIRIDSLVTGVYYNGICLSSDTYIKKGTNVTAFIDPIYEPEPSDELDTDDDSDEGDATENIINPDTDSDETEDDSDTSDTEESQADETSQTEQEVGNSEQGE